MKADTRKVIKINQATHDRLKLKRDETETTFDRVISDLLDNDEKARRWQSVADETYVSLLRRRTHPDESLDMVITRILMGDIRVQPR